MFKYSDTYVPIVVCGVAATMWKQCKSIAAAVAVDDCVVDTDGAVVFVSLLFVELVYIALKYRQTACQFYRYTFCHELLAHKTGTKCNRPRPKYTQSHQTRMETTDKDKVLQQLNVPLLPKRWKPKIHKIYIMETDQSTATSKTNTKTNTEKQDRVLCHRI